MAKVGIIVFPGSNCDHDCYYAIKEVMGAGCEFIWHGAQGIDDFDLIVLPGGFSYGDYLRAGAIAQFSPIMGPVKRFAEKGGLVLGICNGFQMLTETGLLPGALIRNGSLRFICRWVHVRVESSNTPFTQSIREGTVLRIPIAHGEGRFFSEPAGLKEIEEGKRVVFRYCDSEGKDSAGANPNGSLSNVAGLTNKSGNVLGMMPHPERCCEEVLGGKDGALIFESVLTWIDEKSRTKKGEETGKISA